MIDLHSHVLFDIDDGAETIEDSVAILTRAQKMGIRKMVATPHFSVGEDVDSFIKRRDRRIDMLKERIKEEGIDITLYAGAEVYITDELFNESDLKLLTLAGSDTLLAEFKYHALRPEDFLEYIDEMISQGVRVLVAHPERYSFLRGNMRLINAAWERGVLFQVNAISLFDEGEDGEAARMMVKNNLAFAIGSDIHHPSSKRLDAMGKLGESGRWDKLFVTNPKEIVGYGKD